MKNNKSFSNAGKLLKACAVFTSFAILAQSGCAKHAPLVESNAAVAPKASKKKTTDKVTGKKRVDEQSDERVAKLKEKRSKEKRKLFLRKKKENSIKIVLADGTHFEINEDTVASKFRKTTAPNKLSGKREKYRKMAYETAMRYADDEGVRKSGLNSKGFANVFTALIRQESNFNPRAVSSAGAKGLGQLMPGTARMMGVKDSFKPQQNLDGAAEYLIMMLNKFGSVEKALAAYNAGPGRVQQYGGVPPFRETQDYVSRISSNSGLRRKPYLPDREPDNTPPQPQLTGAVIQRLDIDTSGMRHPPHNRRRSSGGRNYFSNMWSALGSIFNARG